MCVYSTCVCEWMVSFCVLRGTMEGRHQLDFIEGFELEHQCGMALVSHRELCLAARP
jgi:hypothetical protein